MRLFVHLIACFQFRESGRFSTNIYICTCTLALFQISIYCLVVVILLQHKSLWYKSTCLLKNNEKQDKADKTQEHNTGKMQLATA